MVAEPFVVAHREGRPVTEGEPDWSGPAPRRREVIPVRHDGVVVAVLAKDTNLAVTRSPSTLELTYLDIAADLCLMVSAGHLPAAEAAGRRDEPARRRRPGPARRRRAGSPTPAPTRCRPTAGSASTGDLVGRRAGRAHPVGRGRPGGGRGGGRGHRRRGGRPVPRRRWTSRARSATMLVRALPLHAPGRGGGRARAGARRHRRPPAGPGAAHQGRDDPGDPPPGEEQPADGRRAAAAAGAPDDRAGRPGGAGGVGAPGRLDRGRARDAGRQPGGRRRRRRRARPGAADARRPDLGRPGRAAPGASARSGSCRRPRRRRWCWRSPSCCTTPPSTPSPTASRGRIELVAERTGDDLVVRVRDNGRGLPEGFDPAASDGLGLQIVRTLVTSELGRQPARWAPPDGQPGTEVVLTLPGAGLPRR